MPEPTEIAAIRGPLDPDAIERGVQRRGLTWATVEVVSTIESTNADVADAARRGTAEGLVLVAEEQTRGRGRLDRSWISPRGAGLTCSILFRPRPKRGTWGWLPIMVGVALADAVRELSDVDVALKWPNDLLIGPDQAKAGGILAESGDGALVVGVGVNVSSTADELPPGATSLLAEGALVSRAALLVELLGDLESAYAAWIEVGGDAERCGLRAAYRARCATLGQAVTVALPQGEVLSGTAETIDPSGGLNLRTAEGELLTVVAADVVHVRPGN